jgi:hypothetical protein
MSLSGYTVAAGCATVENISTRTVSSVSFRTPCAPSGPGGKQATSQGPSCSSPSGVRSVSRPWRTSNHSSSPYSSW